MIAQHTLTLFELLNNVRTTLKSAFNQTFWVVAEIMECNINRNSHCYFELIEKDANSDKPIAKARATMWAGNAMSILPYFESVTGQTLHLGLKLLMRVSIEMHELYGLSLNIQDIDAQYTLGDIAQQRAKVIAQLEADGVIDMNKELPLPLVIQRVAVISSDMAAGWGDFRNQIENNERGYNFDIELFPALMQGDSAAQSIISALEKIYDRIDEFDAVAIIRGGGSKSDLSCFDQYNLSYYAAQFPLPIITGIGHERDNSVLDMVANVRLKTPTALASFLIDRAANFEQLLTEKCNFILNSAKRKIETQIQLIEHNAQRFSFAVKSNLTQRQEQIANFEIRSKRAIRSYIDAHQRKIQMIGQQFLFASKMQLSTAQNNIERIKQSLKMVVNQKFEFEQNRLQCLELTIDKYNPQKILERGYAIVLAKGKVVKSPTEVASGDEISIKTHGGVIEGIVK